MTSKPWYRRTAQDYTGLRPGLLSHPSHAAAVNLIVMSLVMGRPIIVVGIYALSFLVLAAFKEIWK
ncbi:MAG: hypothetical protein HYY14_02075 [Candidatus Omnitrophica bacterium]|nr:hypothetical protein [Candidatus Omnitrophota bacterium]